MLSIFLVQVFKHQLFNRTIFFDATESSTTVEGLLVVEYIENGLLK